MQYGKLQTLHISFVLFWFPAFPQLVHLLLVLPSYGRCVCVMEARLDGLPVPLRRFTVDPLQYLLVKLALLIIPQGNQGTAFCNACAIPSKLPTH